MNLITLIDYFLDRITMYRLVLYCLLIILGWTVLLGIFSILPYSPVSIVLSTIVLVAVSWISNTVFASWFNAPTNIESSIITGLILACIVYPAQTISEYSFLIMLAGISMATKYILNINRKHIFNPAAIAVAITGLALGQGASWWVGTVWVAPLVAVCGFLIVRKLRYQDMIWAFLSSFIIVSLVIAITKSNNIPSTLLQVFFRSSMLFLGSIMLTEPLTLPPTHTLQMMYGAIVGVLSVPQFHIGSVYFAPEIALSIGNIFAYIVSPKDKLLLYLDQKIRVAPDIYDFVFKIDRKLSFRPGQYMEWTVSHLNTDSRGNRRYFTLASSPTEDTIRLGIKFYENGSSYKRTLLHMDNETPVIGAQLAGDFTLPADAMKKIVFVAGGIGITPFRSMIKYLNDTGEYRDIILLYSNKNENEIVYRDVFDNASEKLGIKVLYTLTDKKNITSIWNGLRGRIDRDMIVKEIPDYKERLFYISGPQTQIDAVKGILADLYIPSQQIKTDYFPGLV